MRYAGFLLLSVAAYANPSHPWVVLPKSLGPEMMRQCSRNTPHDIQRFWTPSTADISVLEERLKIYEKSHMAELQLQLARSHRQYVGFIKSDKRFIYGNFYLAAGRTSPDEATSVAHICDGGPSFWGMVYSVGDGTFLDFEHNGVA